MYFPLDTARCRTLAGRAAYMILLKTTGTTGDPVVAGGWSRRSILMGSRGGSARKSDILPRGIAFNCCWVSVTVERPLLRLFFFLFYDFSLSLVRVLFFPSRVCLRSSNVASQENIVSRTVAVSNKFGASQENEEIFME